MKRDIRGEPVMMVHRWGRPPLSCRPCREKKRRCDRSMPCSNCTQRSIQCEYTEHDQVVDILERHGTVHATATGSGQATPASSSAATLAPPSGGNVDELMYRVRRLEDAVFSNPADASRGLTTGTDNSTTTRAAHITLVPFSYHLQHLPPEPTHPDIRQMAGNLPQIGQARQLFDHFAVTMQPTLGILHIPSTRDRMEQTYQLLLEARQPEASDLLLLFSIFAGSALSWTPQLLGKLNASREEVAGALTAYTRLAASIVDSPELAPSTTALTALETLAHVIMNSDGYPVKVHVIRTRCLLMARALQIHRLDNVRSREERRLNGCNLIEVEVQRRAWWSLVASDWLSAFSGGPQDGAYMFQPQHMSVNYPSNVDDEYVTPTEVKYDHPLSEPTSMVSFLYRVKISDLCRQVVDAMPAILLESSEPDYDIILQLDEKFKAFLNDLPVFLRLDSASIQRSQAVCKERPDIAWQRIGLHFSLHSRLSRLHRPYHLKGLTNSRYTYSRTICIRSAQTVLELRKAMDEAAEPIGLNPARFWTVMQHVFVAALVLATDVSVDPSAPDAEVKEAKVLAAYQMIERSKKESNSLMEGLQKNMQTLLSTLNKRRPQGLNSHSNDQTGSGSHAPVTPSGIASRYMDTRETGGSITTGDANIASAAELPASEILLSPGDEMQVEPFASEAMAWQDQNWDQLWTDFIAVVPELDAPQWNSLLDDIDL